MFTSTWKKYLPVIRLLLKQSSVAEKRVTLNRTDFERNNRLRKPACSFTIELEKGRFSILNKSVHAKDLVDVLMQDDTARALLREHHYAISLNSDFELVIRNCTPVIDIPDEQENTGEEIPGTDNETTAVS